MIKTMIALLSRVSLFFLITLSTLLISLPAWATDEEVTKEVVAIRTEHRWFYWPGWAFISLVIVVLALILLFWYKTVLGPKYRGRKIVQ